MYNHVLHTISKWNMLNSGDCVYVALSGGADSVCLLYLLKDMRLELGIDIHAIHIHHGLRGNEADEDARFCETICNELGIPIEVVYRDVAKESKSLKLSIEEAGRNARYDVFSKLAAQSQRNKIALAHHLNDQAETFLMNAMRGSGLKGLGGIAPVRGQIIRPLIECTRIDIENFCTNNHIKYRVDHTNTLDIYTRNKVRLHLVPEIEKEYNPKFIRQIGVTTQLLREDDAYLEGVASKFIANNCTMHNGRIGISLKALLSIEIPVRRRIYRQVFSLLIPNLQNVEYKHIEAVETLLKRQSGKRVNLPHSLIAERVYEDVHFYKVDKNELVNSAEEWCIPVDLEKGEVVIPGGKIVFRFQKYKNGVKIPDNRYTKWFDYDKIRDTLVLRNRRNGDTINLNGCGDKKLKDFFIDQKIPRDQRACIPILADGDNIMWIIGYRIAHSYKITDDTRHLLEVEYLKEENN